MHEFYRSLLDLSSWIPAAIILYGAYLLGRFRAPTLTKYAQNFKIHHRALVKWQRKLSFISKLRSGLKVAQFVYVFICVAYYFVRKPSRDSAKMDLPAHILEEIFSTGVEIFEFFTKLSSVKLALMHSVLAMMNKSYFFTLSLFVGFWTAYLARAVLYRYQLSLERGLSKLRLKHMNMVREFVEDLGLEFSSKLCKYFNETLTSENIGLKKEVKQLSQKGTELGSKLDNLTGEIQYYRRLVKSTDEFVWCADCISKVHQDGSMQYGLRDQSLSNLFQKDNNRLGRTLNNDCKSAGTPPDLLDQISIREGNDPHKYYPSASSTKQKQTTNCSAACVSRFLEIYQKEKQLKNAENPLHAQQSVMEAASVPDSNKGVSGVDSAKTPQTGHEVQTKSRSLIAKVQSAMKSRTLPHLLPTSSSIKSTHESTHKAS